LRPYLRDSGGIGDVGDECDSLPAELFHQRHGFRRVPEVDRDDVGTALGKSDGNRSSEPSGCTGDDGNATSVSLRGHH
jgi:hypothetical protein